METFALIVGWWCLSLSALGCAASMVAAAMSKTAIARQTGLRATLHLIAAGVFFLVANAARMS